MPDAIGPAPPPAPPLSKSKIFLRRLVSFVVLWTIVLTALFFEQPAGVGLRVPGDHGVPGGDGAGGVLWAGGEAGTWSASSAGGFWAALLLMVGTFLNLTGQLGTSGSPARVNDFETSFLILFVLGLCLRQFFSRSNTAGILAISTTLLRPDVRALAAELHPEDQFLPRRGGALLPALLCADHEVQRHRRLCGRLADRAAQDDPAHQPGQDLGGLCRRHRGFDAGQPALRAFPGVEDGRHELEARDHSGSHPGHHARWWGT